MMSHMRSAWRFIPVVVWLVSVELAAAAPPPIKDDGGFFSAAAASEADAGIRAIKQLFNKDLYFETFKTVPANLMEQLKKDKNKTFVDWAQSQAAKNKIEGV